MANATASSTTTTETRSRRARRSPGYRRATRTWVFAAGSSPPSAGGGLRRKRGAMAAPYRAVRVSIPATARCNPDDPAAQTPSSAAVPTLDVSADVLQGGLSRAGAQSSSRCFPSRRIRGTLRGIRPGTGCAGSGSGGSAGSG
jgi:hypothetical protein